MLRHFVARAFSGEPNETANILVVSHLADFRRVDRLRLAQVAENLRQLRIIVGLHLIGQHAFGGKADMLISECHVCF
jgi:hypothetical protein